MAEISFDEYFNFPDTYKQYLLNAATTVKEKISSLNRINSDEYTKLENYLNSVFYPSEDNADGITYSKQFMDRLRSLYEAKTDKIITSDIGDLTYKALNKKPTLDRSVNVHRASLRTMKSQYDAIVNVINNLADTENAKKIQAVLDEVNKQYGNVLATIEDVLKTYEDEGETTQIGKGIVKKHGGNFEKINEAQNGLRALYNTFNNAGLIILPIDYGDFLEYGLGLLSNEMAEITDNFEDEVIEYMQDKIVLGGKNVARGGGLVDVDMSIKSDFKKKTKKVKNGPTKIFWQYQNITLSYDPSNITVLNTGVKKQGKVDVMLTLPDAMGGEKFRISAKNWKTIDELRNLGSTSLLDAIHRNTGDLELDYYMLSMQNPKEVYMQAADELAKICIFADIAMGLSQEKGYADTLVINDRTAKHLYVRNIPQMILDAVNKNLSSLALKGYDVSSISEEAAKARQIAMRLKEGRLEEYYRIFRSQLRSIEVSVQFLAL